MYNTCFAIYGVYSKMEGCLFILGMKMPRVKNFTLPIDESQWVMVIDESKNFFHDVHFNNIKKTE